MSAEGQAEPDLMSRAAAAAAADGLYDVRDTFFPADPAEKASRLQILADVALRIPDDIPPDLPSGDSEATVTDMSEISRRLLCGRRQLIRQERPASASTPTVPTTEKSAVAPTSSPSPRLTAPLKGSKEKEKAQEWPKKRKVDFLTNEAPISEKEIVIRELATQKSVPPTTESTKGDPTKMFSHEIHMPSTEIPEPLQASRLMTCHEAVKKVLPSDCTYDNFHVSLDLCHAASLPAEEKHFQEMTDREFALRMARISAMGAGFSFHAYERLKERNVALEKKTERIAELEKLRDIQNENNKQLQATYSGLCESYRECEKWKSNFERAFAKSDQELEDLQTKHAELELARATELAEARIEAVQTFKESAPYKEQVQLIAELPGRLEAERKKSVEEYKASPDFQSEIIDYLTESYTAGYDEGKTKGFKQGLNRVILLARQYISEGRSLDDMDLQGEEYFSEPEMETPAIPNEPEKKTEEAAEPAQHPSELLEKAADEVAE